MYIIYEVRPHPVSTVNAMNIYLLGVMASFFFLFFFPLRSHHLEPSCIRTTSSRAFPFKLDWFDLI